MSGPDGEEDRLARRAARILSGLAAGGRLVRVEGGEATPPRYELRVAGERAPRQIADCHLVGEMRRRDWLCGGAEGTLEATAAGRARLARAARRDEPFRAQHLALSAPRPADPAPEAAAVVDNESPLAWLRKRRDAAGRPLIGEAQYRAGERLRADFTRACMTPRITSDWTGTPIDRRRRGPASGRAALTDQALAARARVDRALKAAGPELGGLLVDVCCLLLGLEEAERARGWPRRSAKVVLGIALDRLAAHYGLADEARGRAGGGLRHWGAEGYKPR